MSSIIQDCSCGAGTPSGTHDPLLKLEKQYNLKCDACNQKIEGGDPLAVIVMWNGVQNNARKKPRKHQPAS